VSKPARRPLTANTSLTGRPRFPSPGAEGEPGQPPRRDQAQRRVPQGDRLLGRRHVPPVGRILGRAWLGGFAEHSQRGVDDATAFIGAERIDADLTTCF